jgi:hypothetical protein
MMVTLPGRPDTVAGTGIVSYHISPPSHLGSSFQMQVLADLYGYEDKHGRGSSFSRAI